MSRQWRVGQGDRIEPLCKIVDIPAGDPPKNVVVELPDPDGTRRIVWWTGRPAIAVDDYVMVQRRGTDGLHHIVSADGSKADDESLYLLTDGTRAGASGQAQDFGSNGVKADVIAESTASAGVTISSDLAHTGTNLGVFGTTPTTQPLALTTQLTTITHSAPGTPDYAIADPVAGGYGFTTLDEALTVLDVIENLQARVQELEDKLQALGVIA